MTTVDTALPADAVDGAAVRGRGIAAWEQVMQARAAGEAHAVVDQLDAATLRVVTERMGLSAAESPAGMRAQVAAAVAERAADLELYEGQPYADLTGVPYEAGQRACPRDGCTGTLTAVAGSQHFGADGGAMVDTQCDQGCGISSFDSWVWSRHEAPAEDPTYYADDEDSAQPDDPGPGAAGTNLGWALDAAAIPQHAYEYGPDSICTAHGQRCAAAQPETGAGNGHDDTDGW